MINLKVRSGEEKPTGKRASPHPPPRHQVPSCGRKAPLHQQLDSSPLRLPGCSVSNPERCVCRGRSALPGANRPAGPRSGSAETGTELGLRPFAAQLLPPSGDCNESCSKEKRCVQERINHAMLYLKLLIPEAEKLLPV